MRIGVFSDVHGNLEALKAVLEVYDGLGIDRYVCLGDVVGYGAQPDECCELVRSRASVVVLGNHDAAVAGRMEYEYYYDAARHALDWCRERLSPENLSWLQGLPYEHDDGPIRYTHGNPLNPPTFEYIFALEQARELMPFRDRLGHVNFIGHSHLCKSFALGDEGAREVAGPVFPIRESDAYVITVGSVGQPRDYDNRACCGVYDTDEATFEYVRVEYDIEGAAKRIFDAGLALNFGKRLFLGI